MLNLLDRIIAALESILAGPHAESFRPGGRAGW